LRKEFAKEKDPIKVDEQATPFFCVKCDSLLFRMSDIAEHVPPYHQAELNFEEKPAAAVTMFTTSNFDVDSSESSRKDLQKSNPFGSVPVNQKSSNVKVGQRLSCTEYFIKQKEWMCDTHTAEPGAVGVLMCPKTGCGEQIGLWGHSLQCTCDKIVRPAFLVYKSKLR
jgi:hypothetical protein